MILSLPPRGSGTKRWLRFRTVRWMVPALSHLHLDLCTVDVDRKPRSVFPHRGDRQFYLLVNITLQKARAVLHAETLFGHQINCWISSLERFTLPLHLATSLVEVELRDLLDLIHGQRRENDNLVDAIAKFRREAKLCGLHDFVLDSPKIGGCLGAKTERLFVFLETIRTKV